jgi:predicted phosphodiesterase
MREVKLKKEDFDNIYFASDFHYNHQADFIWTPRGFSTAQEHDAWLDTECAKLTEKDLLIFLGDTALNSSYEETERFMLGIKAKKFWIWGNHYSWDYPLYQKALGYYGKEWEIYPLSLCEDDLGVSGISGYCPESRLVFFGQELNLKINHSKFYCRHIAPLLWDKMRHGVMALCGHSHGNCSLINLDNKTGKILDVGVDNAKKYNGTAFFKYEEVLEIMSYKRISELDHH